MAAALLNQPAYFPAPRAEVAEKLREADAALDAAMAKTVRSISPGDVLVRGGEPQNTIYRLLSGKVARVRSIQDGRRQIICIFSPGDVLAVKAMLLDRQPDNIEALSESTVASLGHTEALALAAQDPNVSLRFMWQLAEDERRLHNSVTMLGRGTALERISTVLLDLQARLVQFGKETAPISIRQQDLADYAGLTLVHVNRTLRALREEGALDTGTGEIIIRDLAALHKHAAPMLDIFERETPEFGARAH